MSDPERPSLSELASIIESNYLPFAWVCGCKGADPDCSQTMREDIYAIAQADTVLRITKLLRELGDTNDNI